ncbi:MAG: endolytic transglycosylase MltG [Patescibacteria group bacterium]|nr:endolytic transglycosylase MltG [Patescibacteria group bacterium]
MFRKFFSLGFLSLTIIIIGAYLFWQWAIKPVDPQNQANQVFVVPQGQSAKIISKRLQAEKLIKNQLAFNLLVDQQNLSNKLQAGDFRLSPSMDLKTIIDSLTHGSLDYWITFPEGLRVEEYAERLAAKSDLNPQDFILAAKSFEGRLFPDTYLIPQTASVEDIVALLTETFTQKSPTQDKDLIILASLIEREAKHSQDRPLVSSVLHNRLKINMALQIDATVQYAIGKSDHWWKKDLTKQDLAINSPYNTYLHPDLPPRPIANPGLASLQAAVNPATTNYLFYISDSSGINHYATTLEEHNQNIAEYLQ